MSLRRSPLASPKSCASVSPSDPADRYSCAVIFLRILTKIAIGAFIGGVLGSFFTGGDWAYTLVWSFSTAVGMVAATLAGFQGRFRRRVPPASGLSLARIETIQRTGLQTNGRQECELRLVVAATDVSAYTTTTRLTMATDDLRGYVSGTVLVVARPAPNRPDVTIVPSPPQEWVTLAEQATHDPSLIPVASAAPAWEPATTTAPGTARPGSGRGSFALVASLFIVVVAAAVTLFPAYGSIGRTFGNVAAGDWDGNSMITGSHQQVAIDEIAAIAGSYQFTDVGFYDGYVIVDGLTTPGADTTDEYIWRYGRATRQGAELIQSSDLAAELFDASGLDFSMVGTVVEKAVAASGLDDIDSVNPRVARTFEGGAPVIYVYVSDAYRDATFTYGFDGVEIERSGSAFE